MSDDRCPHAGCWLALGHGGDHQGLARMPENVVAVAGCIEKKSYRSEAHANGVAARIFDERGTWLRSYFCTSCGQWHLTKTKVHPKPGWRPPAPSKQGRAAADRERYGRKRRR